MARTWIIPAGAGVLSALLLFLAVAMGSVGAVILGNLAPLPLFAMGLGAGLMSAAAAGATAAALVGLIAGIIPAMGVIVLFVMPAVVLVRSALLSRIDAEGRLEWYPPGRLVTWLVGIGALTFFAALLLVSGGRTVEDRMRSFFAPLFNQYQGVPPEQLHLFVEALARLPSIMVLVWLLIIAGNGILAQGLLSGFHYNLRPSPRVAQIELPRTVGFVTAISIAATALGSGWLEFVGRNLLLLLALAFFFAGLGVVHHFARGTHRLVILAAFYASMVPFFLLLVAFVTLLGFVDHWAHLRQRFGGSPAGSV